jgi:hypothetical protein
MAIGRKTGGRAKGTPNKNTTDVAAMARQLVEDVAYQAMFKARLNGGTLPPGVEQMMWHYAYGKPIEHLHVGGDDGGPVLIKFVGVDA